jgi:hypothetical protein
MSTRRPLTLLLLLGVLVQPAHAGGSGPGCRRLCRDRAIVCAAHGRRRDGCRAAALRACRRDGASACPALDRDRFAADVAASIADELVEYPGLCVATLPPVSVASTEEALGVGRDLAAALVGVSPSELHTTTPCRDRRCSDRAYFDELAVQGTLGAGGALQPFGRIVAALADGVAAVYSRGVTTPNAFAIVGRKDGLAFGIVLTNFGADCAR